MWFNPAKFLYIINKHVLGNILDGKEDPIFAMNTAGEDLSDEVGMRFFGDDVFSEPAPLGSVKVFTLDEKRLIHFIFCHELGPGGWRNADVHLLTGLNRLAKHADLGKREYGIVEIGKGRVGRRDGANGRLLNRAMANSQLNLTLYLRLSGALIPQGKLASEFGPLKMICHLGVPAL